MAGKNINIELTPVQLFEGLLTGGGTYCSLPGYSFTCTLMPTKDEFQRRYSQAGGLKEEEYQVIRYLAMLSYADQDMLELQAVQFKAKKVMNNVITYPYAIREICRSLVRKGVVCKRYYCDPLKCDTSDGTRIPPQGSFGCYCLSDHGKALYKDGLEGTLYIEENMQQKNQLEIMRRLATNYAVLTTGFIFRGEASAFNTERTKTTGRQPIYGYLKNDSHFVVYEPAFFRRDKTIQTEEELMQHYELRNEFLVQLFANRDYVKDENVKKHLVLIVEDKTNIDRALEVYSRTTSLVDQVFLTGENILRYSNGAKEAGQKKIAPFFKVDMRSDGSHVLLAGGIPDFFK